MRPFGDSPQQWVATGFTLQEGANRRDILPQFVRFGLAATQPLDVALTLHPDERLSNGEQSIARTTVTRSGVPQPGLTVAYSTADTALADVSPQTAQTDASGIAEATVEGRSSQQGQTLVIAEVDGRRVEKVVLVPRLSTIGLLLALGGIGIVVLVRDRRTRRS